MSKIKRVSVGTSCALRGCTSRTGSGEGLSLFSFPKDIARENLQKEQTKAILPLPMHQESITKYQLLLQKSGHTLQEKSAEMEKMRSEIRQLKVRQVALEEQNLRCPTRELEHMVEESQRKLHEVMKRAIESEHTVEKYVNIIEKQIHQINEMDNLLRYRENMTNVMKASRDELLQEKESLINYSQEIKTLLTEVTKQSKIKDSFVRELQEKIYILEKQIKELKKVVKKLETELVITNEKRYKMQEIIEILENRLENNKRHFNQLSEVDSRYENELQCYPIPQCHVNDCNSVVPMQSQMSQSVNQFEGPSITPNMTRTLKELSGCKNCSGCVLNKSKFSKLRKKSKHNLRNLNLSIFSDSNSEHLNCHHKVNSRSLISLSLQTVDFLKTRLNFLTSVNMLLPENADISSQQRMENNQTTSSAQTPRRKKVSQERVGKILKLSAKRYEYLQNQAIESYEDLTNLVKLAATQECGLKK